MNGEPPNYRTAGFLGLFILVILLLVGEVYWSLLITKSQAVTTAGSYQRHPHPAKAQPAAGEPVADASGSWFPRFYSLRFLSEPPTVPDDQPYIRRDWTKLPSRSPLSSSPGGPDSASASGQTRIAVVDVDLILARLRPDGYSKAELKSLLPTIKTAVASVASENHFALVINRSAQTPNSSNLIFTEEDWFDLTEAVLSELEKTAAQVTAR